MSQGGGRGAGLEGVLAADLPGRAGGGVGVGRLPAFPGQVHAAQHGGCLGGPPVLGGGGWVMVRPGGSSGFWLSLAGRKLCSPRPPTRRPFASVEKLLQRLGAEAWAPSG